MEAPALIAAQMAITQQNVALSMIKKTADMQQQISTILMSAVDATRGSNVNIAA